MPPLYGKKMVLLLYENRTCPGKTGQLVTLVYTPYGDQMEELRLDMTTTHP